MTVEAEIHAGIAKIALVRPDKRNAITAAMYAQLAQALTAASADRTVRAVILTGAGGHFTAGNDLEDFLRNPPVADRLDWSISPFNFMKALLDCDKPVIAAVSGNAVGIGATMLLHCDFVVIADDARITMPFVNLGLVPEFASSLLLPAQLGYARAAAKLLLGEALLPNELLHAGLANAVVPAAQVLPHAHELAGKLCRLAPAAVRASKRLMRGATADQVLAVIAKESAVFAERLRGPEAREAMQAFFAKRAPDFSRCD